MFDDIVRDIKDLKIQSAMNVATKGLEALHEKTLELKSLGDKKDNLSPFVNTLISTRSTEPALRNILKLYLKDLQNDLSNAQELYANVLQYVENISQKIREYGANEIQDGMVLFTHCHSSFVVDVMIEAKKRGRTFEVYNTETRPKFQGRITAQELADNGITVHHVVDSAGYNVLKKADLFLFGADAVNAYGNVYNKVGTRMFTEMCNKYDVKTFCVTPSLKFGVDTVLGIEEKIEERPSKEVWDIKNDRIIIHNPAFDEVEKENVDAIISEFGVLSVDVFIETARKLYK